MSNKVKNIASDELCIRRLVIVEGLNGTLRRLLILSFGTVTS